MLFRRRRGARVRGEEGAMDGRWIYLESVSGEGVRAFGLPFQKPCLYCIVSVGGCQRKKTAADHVRGKNPKWDLPMRFDLDAGADQIIEFQLMSRGNPLLMRRGRLAGDVKVPVSALLADGGHDGALCHASYQVRTPSGKANGVLTFSYRISFPRAAAAAAADHHMRALPPPGGMYHHPHQAAVVPVYVMPHHPQQVMASQPPPQHVMPPHHPQQVGGAYYLAPAPYYPQLSPPPSMPPPPYGYRTG